MKRSDGRDSQELRPIKITPGYIKQAPGSVLFEMGETKVICTAMLEDKVPPHVEGTGRGWLTSEYGMLPGSTLTRKPRDGRKGQIDGRTQEIQRLVGRCLRTVSDLNSLPDRTVWIDCDVIQADGGTRTAAVNGAWIALCLASRRWEREKKLSRPLLREKVAAVSVGLVKGTPCLDLCYQEDYQAEVDMNLVFTESGRMVEIQGTAEGKPFSQEMLQELVQLGWKGAQKIFSEQEKCLLL